MFDAIKLVAFGGSLLLATTAGALEDIPAVPSGLSMSLHETLTDKLPDGTTALRLRFVVPEIGSDLSSYTTVADDFATLCESVGLPVLAQTGQSVDQIIVSFSDRKTAFGVANPDATQYFEVFTLENDTCIWEAF
jgi:hypothetical protein